MKKSNREEGGGDTGTGILFEEPNPTFIQEGTRAPVSKATHARNWVSPISEDGRDLESCVPEIKIHDRSSSIETTVIRIKRLRRFFDARVAVPFPQSVKKRRGTKLSIIQ